MSDWTTDAVDNIERVVTTVRDKTVTPAQNAARAIVFGLLTSFFVATAPDARLDRSVPPGRRLPHRGVWATYLVFGGIFVVAGTFCWAGGRRRPRRMTGEPPHDRCTRGRHRRLRPRRAHRRRLRGPGQPRAARHRGRSTAGGQLMLTTDVENYPGFPDGIMGPELMMKFREQAERFGAEFVTADVDRVDLSASPFGAWVGDDGVPRRGARSSRPAPRPGCSDSRPRQRLLGHGVSTCATCDGFFFREKRHRGRRRRRLRDRGGALPHEVRDQGHGDPPTRRAAGVEDHAGPRVRRTRRSSSAGTRSSTDVVGDGERRWRRASATRVTGDGLELRRRRACSSRSATIPNTTLFKGQLDLDENGYVVTARPARRARRSRACSRPATSQDHVYRQAITAAGTGCMAAIEAERWLEAAPPRRRPGMTNAGNGVETRRRFHLVATLERPVARKDALWAPTSRSSPTHTFDETVGGAGHARARRLLGRVVRSVQDDRPDARRDRLRARGQAARSPSSTSTTTRKRRCATT